MLKLENKQVREVTYQFDRKLHHDLCLQSYKQSFDNRGLTERHKITELRRLKDVFQNIEIGDDEVFGIRRSIDTFDLINSRLSKKITDACYQILEKKFNRSRAKACLKAVDRYCKFLQDNPSIYIPGQKTLNIIDLYGVICSPINRYTISREKPSDASRIYLTDSEYKLFLSYLWDKWNHAIQDDELKPVHQMFFMCVIAGELGLRSKEILGLELQHLNLADNICIVTKGKGSKGSGHKKRDIPLNHFLKVSLNDFLKHFSRNRNEPLFQNQRGKVLSSNTASKWMNKTVKEMKALGLPIVFENRFGWHALRRTYARGYLDKGGDFMQLMKNTGWKFASTASCYIGASKLPINYGGV